MTFFSKLGDLLGLPEVSDAEFEQTRKEVLGDYTPAELREMEREDTKNYVANLCAHPMRRVSYNEDDTVETVELYVVDRCGREHIIDRWQTDIVPQGADWLDYEIGKE